MTQLQAIKSFLNIILKEKVIISKTRLDNNYAMDVFASTPKIMLPSNLNYESDEYDKYFRKDINQRNKITKGFADITLTLLHECGHWKTKDLVDWDKDSILKDNINTQDEYTNLFSERIATDWAIDWLLNPKNRKQAKEFERVYFGH